MKFSNGCWLQKERCECFSPAEVYFSKIEKDQVTICAPTSKITQRGDDKERGVKTDGPADRHLWENAIKYYVWNEPDVYEA